MPTSAGPPLEIAGFECHLGVTRNRPPNARVEAARPDGFETDARAIEHKCQRDGGTADPQHGQAAGYQRRRCDLRPDRMMITRDHHLDRSRRHLTRADKGAEADSRRQGEALALQDGQQMHRHDGRDHRRQRDRGSEKKEHAPL